MALLRANPSRRRKRIGAAHSPVNPDAEVTCQLIGSAGILPAFLQSDTGNVLCEAL
jgi:hypothetical protein